MRTPKKLKPKSKKKRSSPSPAQEPEDISGPLAELLTYTQTLSQALTSLKQEVQKNKDLLGVIKAKIAAGKALNSDIIKEQKIIDNINRLTEEINEIVAKKSIIIDIIENSRYSQAKTVIKELLEKKLVHKYSQTKENGLNGPESDFKRDTSSKKSYLLDGTSRKENIRLNSRLDFNQVKNSRVASGYKNNREGSRHALSRSPLKPSKLNGAAPRNLSKDLASAKSRLPNSSENVQGPSDPSYCDILYQRGMEKYQLHAERAEEKRQADLSFEMREATFKPQINKQSAKMSRHIRPLRERTDEKVSFLRDKCLKDRSASYRVGGKASALKDRRNYEDLSNEWGPEDFSHAKNKKKYRVVLDPQDNNNFYKKNMEWLNLKNEKISYLQSVKKNKEEHELDLICGPRPGPYWEEANGEYQRGESLVSPSPLPLHNPHKDPSIYPVLSPEGSPQAKKRLNFGDESNPYMTAEVPNKFRRVSTIIDTLEFIQQSSVNNLDMESKENEKAERTGLKAKI